MITVHISPDAGCTPCPVTSRWDDDGLAASCSVRYPPESRASRAFPLRDALDAQFGFRTPNLLILAGDLTITLDRHGRLLELDCYTNPDTWRRVHTRPSVTAHGLPTLVASFDAFGRVEIDAPRLLYTREPDTLQFVWQDAAYGYAVPGLCIGATADHALAQLTLTPFPLPATLR
jgi:hypothetical protein